MLGPVQGQTRWRHREAAGTVIIVRYADDLIIGFEHQRDARRFWDAMRDRLQEFSLSFHPEKTRLIEFGRFAAERRAQSGLGKPETFNFLDAGSSKLWKQRDRWHPKSKGQSRNTLRITAEGRRRQHEQGIHSFLAGVENGTVQIRSASHYKDFKLYAQELARALDRFHLHCAHGWIPKNGDFGLLSTIPTIFFRIPENQKIHP